MGARQKPQQTHARTCRVLQFCPGTRPSRPTARPTACAQAGPHDAARPAPPAQAWRPSSPRARRRSRSRGPPWRTCCRAARAPRRATAAAATAARPRAPRRAPWWTLRTAPATSPPRRPRPPRPAGATPSERARAACPGPGLRRGADAVAGGLGAALVPGPPRQPIPSGRRAGRRPGEGDKTSSESACPPAAPPRPCALQVAAHAAHPQD